MLRTFHISNFIYVLALSLLFSVKGIGQITLNGGDISLAITAGIAGGQLIDVTSTTTSLSYQKQKDLLKITVSTSCPGQRFTLKVLATNVTKGVAAPEIMLVNGAPVMDFITDIPKTGAKTGTCTLQYTASATFSQGNSNELGNDVHTVTYTIQVQ